MPPSSDKSIDLALETSKQVITLATATLALSITFLDATARHEREWSRVVLAVGWSLFLVSVVAGVGALMTLTGNLAAADSDNETPLVYRSNTALLVGIQIVTFVSAIVCTVAFGIAGLL